MVGVHGVEEGIQKLGDVALAGAVGAGEDGEVADVDGGIGELTEVLDFQRECHFVAPSGGWVAGSLAAGEGGARGRLGRLRGFHSPHQR